MSIWISKLSPNISLEPTFSRVSFHMSDSTATHDLSNITVIDCFEKSLPHLGRTVTSYKNVKSSSKTTEAAIPPSSLLCKTGTSVLKTTDDYLQRKCIKESNLVSQLLGTEFVQARLDNETELVFASSLYIVKPILEVLQCLYGTDKFTLHSELNTKIEYLEQGEQAVRVDLVFRTNDQEPKVILVVEYKRREQIRYGNFQKALLPINASADDIRKKAAEANRAEHGSLLTGNALPFTKQVTMYAKQNKCRYVALLNWDHLLLFEFNKMQDAVLSETTAGPTAELAWFSEAKPDGTYVRKSKIRKALLGFILQVFEEQFPGQGAA